MRHLSRSTAGVTGHRTKFKFSGLRGKKDNKTIIIHNRMLNLLIIILKALLGMVWHLEGQKKNKFAAKVTKKVR